MTNPDYINKPLDDRLTPLQSAALVVIMEEATEVAQAAAKVLRFGFTGKGPPHDFGMDNYALLHAELRDLHFAVTRLLILVP